MAAAEEPEPEAIRTPRFVTMICHVVVTVRQFAREELPHKISRPWLSSANSRVAGDGCV